MASRRSRRLVLIFTLLLLTNATLVAPALTPNLPAAVIPTVTGAPQAPPPATTAPAATTPNPPPATTQPTTPAPTTPAPPPPTQPPQPTPTTPNQPTNTPNPGTTKDQPPNPPAGSTSTKGTRITTVTTAEPNGNVVTLTLTTTTDGIPTDEAVPTDGASADPGPNKSEGGGGSSGNVITAVAVVGGAVVAAAFGIWIFRKWKLSPSRGFKEKIQPVDFSPRSHESDTMFLRELNEP